MPSRDTHAGALLQALVMFFRPIVRLAFRKGLGVREMIEVLKIAAIEVGERELASAGTKITSVKLCALTGLYRQEIERLRSYMTTSSEREPRNPIARVLSAWENSKKWQTARKESKVLNQDEFAALVASVTKTLPANAVLQEVLRTGAVIETPRGFQLARATEIAEDSIAVYKLIAEDCQQIFHVAQENLARTTPRGHLHHRTLYDNIYKEAVPHLQEWILNEGREFHRRIREYLSQFDADLNPSLYEKKDAGVKIAVTSVGYVDEQSKRGHPDAPG